MTICFDIGGSTIKVGVEVNAEVVRLVAKVPTPTLDFEALAQAIGSPLHRDTSEEPLAVAIAGVIDPETGVVTCANIPCIHGRRLASDLRERLQRPVLIMNDADCFALAEASAGAGRGHRIVFGAILGTGVGGGLVIDGRPVVGTGGLTGEWGHGPITDRRPGTPPVTLPRLPCGCGQDGCLDTFGGARGLERLHAELHNRSLTSEAIIQDWGQGEPEAERTIDIYVDLVSGPLALVVNVTGAGVVPVGGGLSAVAGLIQRLDTAVRGRILRRTDRPLVVPGTSGPEPGLLGAYLFGRQATAGAPAQGLGR